jgi:hypothetical protein
MAGAMDTDFCNCGNASEGRSKPPTAELASAYDGWRRFLVLAALELHGL